MRDRDEYNHNLIRDNGGSYPNIVKMALKSLIIHSESHFFCRFGVKDMGVTHLFSYLVVAGRTWFSAFQFLLGVLLLLAGIICTW